MIVYEFRESVLNNAMDELDMAKEGIKMSKKALCNIEDLLCDLYEEEHKDGEERVEEVYDEVPSNDEYETTVEGNDIDINYRRRRNMRMRNMRMHGGASMRNMRTRKALNRYSY